MLLQQQHGVRLFRFDDRSLHLLEGAEGVVEHKLSVNVKYIWRHNVNASSRMEGSHAIEQLITAGAWTGSQRPFLHKHVREEHGQEAGSAGAAASSIHSELQHLREVGLACCQMSGEQWEQWQLRPDICHRIAPVSQLLPAAVAVMVPQDDVSLKDCSTWELLVKLEK